MDKQYWKRSLFFWVDKLQISKRERYTLTVVLTGVLIMLLLDIVIKERVVPPPENHAEILAEFERRSALIEREKLLQVQKYDGIEITEHAELVEQEASSAEPININTATTNELTSLPGIGETYAQRIIEYRETNGDFTSVDELINIKGIGERTLEKIKPFVKL